MILVCLQGKPFSTTVIQVYVPTMDAKEIDPFYEDLEDLLELTPKKDVLFIRDWNAKEESQDIPGATGKFGLGVQSESRAKANRDLSREHVGDSKHLFQTT